MDEQIKYKKLKIIKKRIVVDKPLTDDEIRLLYFVVNHFGFIDGLESTIEGTVDEYGFYGCSQKKIVKKVFLTDECGICIKVETNNDENMVINNYGASTILAFLNTVFFDEINDFMKAYRDGYFMYVGGEVDF